MMMTVAPVAPVMAEVAPPVMAEVAPVGGNNHLGNARPRLILS
jgi:hypothetical protein